MDEKLGADLELFTQARLAPGDLRSGAVVTAKVRGVDHANRVLIGDGQGKQCAGLLLHLTQQRRVDPVAGEVEKPDMPRGKSQLIEAFAARLRAAVELGRVEQRHSVRQGPVALLVRPLMHIADNLNTI